MADQFTPKAQKLWNELSANQKTSVLNNVFCPNCLGSTTIIQYSGEVEQGHLVLSGSCEKCGHKVGRLIESY